MYSLIQRQAIEAMIQLAAQLPGMKLQIRQACPSEVCLSSPAAVRMKIQKIESVPAIIAGAERLYARTGLYGRSIGLPVLRGADGVEPAAEVDRCLARVNAFLIYRFHRLIADGAEDDGGMIEIPLHHSRSTKLFSTPSSQIFYTFLSISLSKKRRCISLSTSSSIITMTSFPICKLQYS